jgi:hypothetical protein
MRSVARWPNADSRAELEFPRHLLYAWVTRVTKWSMVWCRQPIFFYFFSPLQFPCQTLLFSKQSFNLFCLQIYSFEYFVLFKRNWNWFLISSFLNSFLFFIFGSHSFDYFFFCFLYLFLDLFYFLQTYITLNLTDYQIQASWVSHSCQTYATLSLTSYQV